MMKIKRGKTRTVIKMPSLGEVVQDTVGFVKFRGKWIPRLLAKLMIGKLALCNGSEGHKMYR